MLFYLKRCLQPYIRKLNTKIYYIENCFAKRMFGKNMHKIYVLEKSGHKMSNYKWEFVIKILGENMEWDECKIWKMKNLTKSDLMVLPIPITSVTVP